MRQHQRRMLNTETGSNESSARFAKVEVETRTNQKLERVEVKKSKQDQTLQNVELKGNQDSRGGVSIGKAQSPQFYENNLSLTKKELDSEDHPYNSMDTSLNNYKIKMGSKNTSQTDQKSKSQKHGKNGKRRH